MILPKWIAISPHEKKDRYLKYGFVIMECVSYLCPRCGGRLNAGPGYQPKYCDRCGQKLNFMGIEWEPERAVGFAERRGEDEQVEDRVV